MIMFLGRKRLTPCSLARPSEVQTSEHHKTLREHGFWELCRAGRVNEQHDVRKIAGYHQVLSLGASRYFLFYRAALSFGACTLLYFLVAFKMGVKTFGLARTFA